MKQPDSNVWLFLFCIASLVHYNKRAGAFVMGLAIWQTA